MPFDRETRVAASDIVHRVPKLAAALFQTCLIQFVVRGF